MDPREGIRGAVGQITRGVVCLDRGPGDWHNSWRTVLTGGIASEFPAACCVGKRANFK
ncbi:MAG: hypothetical protein WA974_11790 [Thermodesulfobacteriota bacterium]